MAKRKAIPKEVRDKLLVEAMHRCCLCPEHHDVTDLHHVMPISESGPNTEDNLVVICPTCHAKIHRIRKRYSPEQLRMYKERWVGLCALGLPLDVRIAQAFDYTRPPTLPQMPQGIPTPPTPYIAHPCPAQAHFTGRKRERVDLTAWLADDAHPLLAVIAIGGMGKSALGWHWLQNDLLPSGLEHWALQGALWWCFYDRESGFERFLERAVAYVSGEEMDAANWSLRDRMDCLRALLAERPFLLVLDGAERLLRAYACMDAPYLGDEEVGAQRSVHQASPHQCADPNVGTFLQWLAGLKATKTLPTSRLLPRELEGLAGVTRRDLMQMDPEDAVRFFRAMDIQGTRAEIQAACRWRYACWLAWWRRTRPGPATLPWRWTTRSPRTCVGRSCTTSWSGPTTPWTRWRGNSSAVSPPSAPRWAMGCCGPCLARLRRWAREKRASALRVNGRTRTRCEGC